MTAPEEIRVTPELRAAVYAADCKARGHIYDVMVGYGATDDPDVIAGRPAGDGVSDELPHLYCRRCQRVWLVLADSPGVSYDDAEEKVTARLKAADPLVTRAKGVREQRIRRRVAAAELAARIDAGEVIPHTH